MNKNVRIYETLDSASNLNRERTIGGLRLTGVFGKCGVRNSNNRIYEKGNYGKMVSLLQEEIQEKHGVMGELEHPNSMNINLNNVSHKIESIQMNEDGTVTGSILLLNTSKGKEAQAIIEGGLDLYISSRASGQIDKDGNVILESLKTYDLVGTPGFSEARMSICESLRPNEKVQAINESLYYVFEDVAEDVAEDVEVKEQEDEETEIKISETEPKSDGLDAESTVENIEDVDAVEIEDETNKECVGMELLEKILTRLDAIEKKLECCADKAEVKATVRGAVEESKTRIIRNIANGVQNWITEEYGKHLIKHIGESVEKWITEEYSGVVQKWITEEYSDVVEKWINEEFAFKQIKMISEGVQRWATEELSNEIYAKVSDFIQESHQTSLDTIDSILDLVERKDDKSAAEAMINEANLDFIGNIALEIMPEEYRPLWNMCNESKKADILNRAKLYDFTKEGTADKFWGSVDFTMVPVQEQRIDETLNSAYENRVINAIRKYRKL